MDRDEFVKEKMGDGERRSEKGHNEATTTNKALASSMTKKKKLMPKKSRESPSESH